MGRRPCEEEGCSKWGIGSTRYCEAHGGGKQLVSGPTVLELVLGQSGALNLRVP
jgi:hypothetical protein